MNEIEIEKALVVTTERMVVGLLKDR